MRTPKSETVIVTPAIAEDWLANAMYERQRRRSGWHVKRLCVEMEKGRFLEGTQIHFGVLDSQPFLVNGQHTLAAIAQSGLPIRLNILRTPVDNEDELGQLYSRHDRHRGRTPADAFSGMNLAAKLDLSVAEVNAFGPALKLVLNGFRSLQKTNNVEVAFSLDHLAEQMIEWQEPAGTYFEAVREAGMGLKIPFRRSPVVAIGLVTMKHRRTRAKEFWETAAANDGLVKFDPRQALVNFLLREGARSGSPIMYARNVAATWNRFYDKGELKVLRPSDAGKVGITIGGTPYKAAKRPGAGSADDGDEDVAPAQFQGALAVGLMG